MGDTIPLADPCGKAGAAPAQGPRPRLLARAAGEPLPVVVIGAGPVGLAAAAQLHERGLPFTVLEAGPSAGAAVAEWGHVRLFSPWRYDVDPAGRRILETAGWAAPDPEVSPTGRELVEEYLRPLAQLPALASHIRNRSRVTALGRVGLDRVRSTARADAPFVVRLDTGEDLLASAVIDASGTWYSPNVLGANGLPAHGEARAAALVAEHALPDVLGGDRTTYAGRHTVVVGAGHSAANTLLALAELAEQEPGTRVTWAVRGDGVARLLGNGEADALPRCARHPPETARRGRPRRSGDRLRRARRTSRRNPSRTGRARRAEPGRGTRNGVQAPSSGTSGTA